MRAQSIRRALWFANLGVGVAAAGAIAWFVLNVRDAVADPSFLKPAWAQDQVEEFKQTPAAGSALPGRQIKLEEIEEIDKPEFKDDRGAYYHWIYSGDLPPPRPVFEEKAPVEAPVVDELERLGRVRLLAYIPPEEPGGVAEESLLLWEFQPSGVTRTFKPGEAIREKDPAGPALPPEERNGLWLEDVRPQEGSRDTFDLVYRIYEKGKEPRTGSMPHDTLPPEDPKWANVIRTETPATAAGGTGEASTAGGGVGTVEGTPAVAEGTSTEPGRIPDFSELQPTFDENPETGGYDVKFDEATFDYFRNANADSIASTVQTTPLDGVGLQITGISEGSPADRFKIRPGDVLVSINDQPVASRSDAMGIVQRIPEETKSVKVVIDRNGRQVVYNIDPRDPRNQREARYFDENR